MRSTIFSVLRSLFLGGSLALGARVGVNLTPPVLVLLSLVSASLGKYGPPGLAGPTDVALLYAAASRALVMAATVS